MQAHRPSEPEEVEEPPKGILLNILHTFTSALDTVQCQLTRELGLCGKGSPSSDAVEKREDAEPQGNSVRSSISFFTESEVEDDTEQSEYFQKPDAAAIFSCYEVARDMHERVPSAFVVPVQYREQLESNPLEEDSGLPVIRLPELGDCSDASRRFQREILAACRQYGAFQVVKHGLSDSMLDELLYAAKEFFDLPTKEKNEYKMSLGGDGTGYGAWQSPYSRNWGDQMVHVVRVNKHINRSYLPKRPSRYREMMYKYASSMMYLNFKMLYSLYDTQREDPIVVDEALKARLEETLAKAYSTSVENIRLLSSGVCGESSIKGSVAVRVNYHPPCPKPELVLGVDPCRARAAFEIVLQNDVPGLQILKEGRWTCVKPIPHAMVVFVGKALENLFNDKVATFKTVEYRVVAHRQRARLSITSAAAEFDEHVDDQLEDELD